MNYRHLILLIICLLPLQLQAAPKAELWDYWLANDASSTETIDHSAWNSWLSQYVVTDKNGLNRVAYGKVKQQDKQRLKRYINNLSYLPIGRYNRNEQQAYWINLYNALTIDVVLNHYPVESILDIKLSSGFFTRGPWKKKLIEVEQQALSLDDIEHRILRPIWQDPRIHYAVNCASIGCPNLSDKAYTADNMEMQLSQGAVEFINHPRGVAIDGDDLEVSSIYDWFAEDFGRSDKAIIEHLLEYAEPDLKARLQQHTRIDDDQYNWQLNELN